MPLLFVDTETTGKADFLRPAEHPSQPRVVQLAAMLADDAGHAVAKLSLVIAPVGWTVPADAARVHGITTDKALRFGVPIATALDALGLLALAADGVVAHNADFDDLVLRGEFARLGRAFAPGVARHCTMKLATPVCKLPGRYGTHKWPSLAEAHRILLGSDFDGAHDALADTEACARVWFELQRRAAPPVAEQVGPEVGVEPTGVGI